MDHKILLDKLRHYGIRGIPYNFFESYLTDRVQYTIVGDSTFELMKIVYGVPQG